MTGEVLGASDVGNRNAVTGYRPASDENTTVSHTTSH